MPDLSRVEAASLEAAILFPEGKSVVDAVALEVAILFPEGQSIVDAVSLEAAILYPEGKSIVDAAVLETALLDGSPPPNAIVPNISGAPGGPITFDGSGSISPNFYQWQWITLPVGTSIFKQPKAYPDNGGTTPIDMTDNVGLWHFEGDATDSSGKGQDLTEVDTPLYVTGKVGTEAIYLNGTSQYLEKDLGGDAPTTDGTISCWVYFESISANQNIIGLGPTATNVTGTWRSLNINPVNRLAFAGHSADISDITGIHVGQWYHVAFTWNSSDLVKVYLNGIEVASNVINPLVTPSTVLSIGHRNQSGTFYTDERVDEVAIWKRVLSGTEIQEIYDLQSTAVIGTLSTFTFTPDVEGTYTIQLDIANPTSVQASATVSFPPPPTVGSTLPLPNQWFLFPDPWLTGRSSIVGKPSQAGITPGIAVPGIDNTGSAVVQQTNSYVSELEGNTNIGYRILASGKTTSGTWGFTSGTASGIPFGSRTIYGENDLRYNWGNQDPWYDAGTSLSSAPYGNAVTSNKFLNTLFIYRRDTSTSTIKVRYRSISTSNALFDSWTETTCTIGYPVFTGNMYAGDQDIDAAQIAVCTLSDGSMRMLVPRENDLDLYSSADGLAWTEVADRICERYGKNNFLLGGSPRTPPLQLQMEASGDYIRFVYMYFNDDTVSFFVRTFVSVDRGATWLEPGPTLAVPASLSNLSDFGHFGFGSVDNNVGSYLLFIRNNTLVYSWDYYICDRTNDWVQQPQSIVDVTGNAEMWRCTVVRTPEWVVLISLVQYGPPNLSTDFSYALIDPNNLVEINTTAFRIEMVDRSVGGVAYYPNRMRAAYEGDKIFLSYGLSDVVPFPTMLSSAASIQLGGWSTKPIQVIYNPEFIFAGALTPIYQHQPTTGTIGASFVDYVSLVKPQWDSSMGVPAGPGSATNTEWTRTTTPVPTINWRSNYLELITFPGDILYRWTDTNPTRSWCVAEIGAQPAYVGSCIEYTLRIDTGPPTITLSVPPTGPRVQIRSFDVIGGGAGGAISIMVVHSLNEVQIFDQTSGVYMLVTPFAISHVDFVDFRIVFYPNITNRCEFQLWYRPNGDSQWYRPGGNPGFTPSLAGAHTDQYVEFGSSGGPSGWVVDWRRVMVMRYNDCGQSTSEGSATGLWTFPDDMRGRLTNTYPTHSFNGIYAVWGGVGGMEQDVYNALADHSYAAVNMLLPSPQQEYRTAAAGTTLSPIQVRLTSQRSTTGTDESSLEHNAISIIGMNVLSVTIEYDDFSTFLSPVDVGTLVPFNVPDLYISAIKGGTIELTPPSGVTLPVGRYCSTDAGDWYLYHQSGSQNAWKIIRNVIENRYHLDAATPVSGTLTVGDTVQIYADRGLLAWSTTTDHRNMRLTFSPETVETEPYHKVGALVAGTCVPIDVPFDWSFDDDEQPNITKFRTRSAVTWAYVEGPPQRTIQGRVIGDASQFRSKVRDLVRQTMRYEERPLVLVLDDTMVSVETGSAHISDMIFYGRVLSGTKMANAGWKQSADGAWYPVGDLGIKIQEEV